MKTRSQSAPATRSRVLGGRGQRVSRGRNSPVLCKRKSAAEVGQNAEITKNVKHELDQVPTAAETAQAVPAQSSTETKEAPPPYDYPHQKISSPTVPSFPDNLQSDMRRSGGEKVDENRRRKNVVDGQVPAKIWELGMPELKAYHAQCRFERKLDDFLAKHDTILEEKLKNSCKEMGKLRIFLSHDVSFPVAGDFMLGNGKWSLLIRGDVIGCDGRIINIGKFSSFLESITISKCLDPVGVIGSEYEVLTEWRRTENATTETDGFQVQRMWDGPVYLEITVVPRYSEEKFALDPKLYTLPGLNGGLYSFAAVTKWLWQYVKTYKLQDEQDNEYINCDEVLEYIFGIPRIRFTEINFRLRVLLRRPAPIVIPYVVGLEDLVAVRPLCCAIDYDVDGLESIFKSFISRKKESEAHLEALDHRIASINAQLKTAASRLDSFQQFSENPQKFLVLWSSSQSKDLKTMLDILGMPEEERRGDFYNEPWLREAVTRYFSEKQRTDPETPI